MAELTPDKILVLYRTDSADSLAFAEHYKTVHGLTNDQLVPLPCSGDEVLADYAAFQTQIETPLTAFVSGSDVDVRCFVVGYGVPGGFEDGDDVIATTSRLSRFGHVYSKGLANPLFNRIVYEPYDEYDTQVAYIASRIDAPSLADAKAVVDNAIKVIRRSVARGTFYFDPYAVINDTDEADYFDELDDFGDLILPLLNLNTFTTKYWDEYTDVVVPRLKNDSFMWAWKSDRAGFSFFKNTSTPRVWLYNADHDSGFSLRSYNFRFLPVLAFNAGYVAAAGAMSDPSPLGHLRPTPFFDAMIRGASVGEAFLYACPMFDWTVSLMGDPLVAIRFPTGSSAPTNTSTTAVFEQTHDNLASAIAYLTKKDEELNNALEAFLPFNELEKAILMDAFNVAAQDNEGSWETTVVPLVRAFVNYWTSNRPQTFNTFLSNKSLKISTLLPDLVGEVLATVGNQYDEGFWKVETEIVNPTTSFHKFHFELDIANNADFTHMITGFSSNPVSMGYSPYFEFEKTPGTFVSVPANGVPSSYVGRRVRFSSPEAEYLDRGQVFYWRVRQTYDSTETDYVESKAIVFT